MKSDLVLEQPRKVTVVEAIVEQIVRQVQAGKLRPGDRLPSERQLIEMLKVSRSSVREALQGLAVMGLIESRPGQGTFVSDNLYRMVPDVSSPGLSSSLQRDIRLKLVEARRIVEGNIARLAAERATDAAIERLGERFERYSALVLQQAYQQAVGGPHHDFHIALAEMAQNAFLTPLVETLLRALPQGLREREFNTVAGPDPQAIWLSELDIHRAINDAVAQRDPAAAGAAMEAHMAFEQRLIVQVFDAASVE